jgi:X-X-X-Leu-X-X-Gly heptad repeat protein
MSLLLSPLLLLAVLQLARSIVEGVERLDRQLRGQEAMDTIGQGIKQLQAQLQQLVDGAQPPQ